MSRADSGDGGSGQSSLGSDLISSMARIKKKEDKIDLSSRGVFHDDCGWIQVVVAVCLLLFNSKTNIDHMMIQIHYNNSPELMKLCLDFKSQKTVSMD